jgi:DnaA-homolog protein
MRQLPLALGLDREPAFEHFVAGANEVVLTALQAMAVPGPPVYLWGPAGVGKTHLLRALAGQWRQQGGRCGWFDAEQPLPWHFDEAWALIVIDGADRLDLPRQHAAFTLFVEAATHGVQVASAGRLPPVDLPVREDLRTRFGWGPVFELQALDDAQVRMALRQEAERRRLNLSDEVLDHLQTRFARDVASLMALLHRLDDFSLAEQRAITVPLLKKMVAEEGPSP